MTTNLTRSHREGAEHVEGAHRSGGCRARIITMGCHARERGRVPSTHRPHLVMVRCRDGSIARLLASAMGLFAGCTSVVEPAPEAPVPDPAPASRASSDVVIAGTDVYVRDEAVLRLDGPDGPVIGRALPGARLRVLGVEGGFVRAVIAGHGHRLNEGVVTDLEGYIDAHVVSDVPVAALEPELEGRIVTGFRRDLLLHPGGPIFAETVCGPLRIVEEHDEAQRVAQLRGGVEITGWVDSPIRAHRGSLSCGQRALIVSPDEPAPAVPPGWEHPDVADASLQRLMRPGESVWWLEDEDTGARCHRMRIERDRVVGDPFPSERGLVRIVYWIERDRAHLEMYGPHGERRRGGRWRRDFLSRCVNAYDIVRIEDEHALVVGSGWNGARVHAYHPDDAERWFRSAAACERAAAERNTPPSSSGEATRLVPPSHAGC